MATDMLDYLNPTTPPLVHIELLPAGHHLVTAHCGIHQSAPTLFITAYMPDDFAWATWRKREPQRGEMDRGDFISEHCYGCEYNYSTRRITDDEVSQINDQLEEDEESFRLPTGVTVYSPCKVHAGDDPIDYCLKNYSTEYDDDGDSDEKSYKQPATAFRANMIFGKANPRPALNYSIYLQNVAFFSDEDDEPMAWYTTQTYQAMNTWFDSPPRVCWGSNNENPNSLVDAIRLYMTAPCNDDLINLEDFEENLDSVRNDPDFDYLLGKLDGKDYGEVSILSSVYLKTYDEPADDNGTLPPGDNGFPPADAVAIAAMSDYKHMGIAYMQLMLSGAATLRSQFRYAGDKANEYAVIPCWRYRHALPDDTTIDGFCSAPVADGSRVWFITSEGQLIGQLPTPAFLQCTSPTPSSSAAAAPAAI